MGWYLRKSVKMGPMRLNFSKRGIGVSTGVKGFRIGTGPRGPYVAGGRGGIYFRQSLRSRTPRKTRVRVTSAVQVTPLVAPPNQPYPPQPPVYGPQPPQPPPPRPQSRMPAYPPPPPPAYAPAPPPTFVPSPPPPRTYHVYSTATLAGISAAQVLGLILSATDPGILLWFASMIAVAAIDWHGFVSLRGRIPWWRLTGGQKFWLVCAYIFFFEIMVPVYLVGAWIDYRRKRVADAQQRPFHIAQLEAEMGMTPATEGTCASCGKPLQAGAQFCSYCRAPVSPRPKVCPSCATVALPDAQWCPKCGAALPSQP
ncbi:MAG TPA: DUF4236 domain-containing protein [Ktedonobacterales bacterium]